MRRTLLLHLVRYKRHGRALVPSRSFRVIARAHVETAENRAIRSFRQDPGLCVAPGESARDVGLGRWVVVAAVGDGGDSGEPGEGCFGADASSV